MKKLMVVLICILLVVAVGLSLFLYSAINNGFSWFSWNFDTTTELANRQVFSADDFDSLLLQYESDTITILPSAGNEIVLEEYMSEWENNMLAQIDTANRSLTISQGKRPLAVMGFWNNQIKLYIPARLTADLTIENHSGSIKSEHNFEVNSLALSSSSGSIKVAGFTVQQDALISTSSGSLYADTLTAGGTATLSASSGSVKAQQIQAQKLYANTNSGSLLLEEAQADTIELKNSSGSIAVGHISGTFDIRSSSGSIKVEGGAGSGSIENTSGSIHLTLQQLTGNLSVKGSSGSQRINLPEDSSFHFQANTSSGSIKTPFDSDLSFNRSGKQATGSVGNSPQWTVECTSTSGSIRVDFS